MATQPSIPPPAPADLSASLHRNIVVLEERRKQEAGSATREERVAEAITNFTGSMRFVYLHLALYGAWIALNLGILPGLPRFDPSFVILAMIASVEAIFLSTFVLISQNRMAVTAHKQASLDLQINLLAEHELTRLAVVVAAIAAKLGIEHAEGELADTTRDVAPERVLDEIEARDL